MRDKHHQNESHSQSYTSLVNDHIDMNNQRGRMMTMDAGPKHKYQIEPERSPEDYFAR
jgi:hypothetical protein